VERDGVQSRLSVIASEEGLRRDQRAELELRAHVGELAGPDADSAFVTVDLSIAQLVEERRGLASRITELESLLIDRKEVSAPASGEAPAPPEVKPVAAPPAEPAREAAAVVAADVAVAVEQAVEPRPPVAAPASVPVAPVAPPAAPPVAHPPHAGVQPAAVPAAPPAIVPKHHEAPGVAAHAPASTSAAAPEAPRPRPAPRQSFDELAFLSSVVGKNDGGAHAAKKEMAAMAPLIERRSSEPLLKAPANIVQEENAGESLLAGIENARLATGEHPLAANVPSNTPIILRPSNTVEQAKTLKCNECGGLNYPTEWYCERCGAELAAL
jgi:hypothetical protein